MRRLPGTSQFVRAPASDHVCSILGVVANLRRRKGGLLPRFLDPRGEGAARRAELARPALEPFKPNPALRTLQDGLARVSLQSDPAQAAPQNSSDQDQAVAADEDPAVAVPDPPAVAVPDPAVATDPAVAVPDSVVAARWLVGAGPTAPASSGDDQPTADRTAASRWLPKDQPADDPVALGRPAGDERAVGTLDADTPRAGRRPRRSRLLRRRK